MSACLEAKLEPVPTPSSTVRLQIPPSTVTHPQRSMAAVSCLSCLSCAVGPQVRYPAGRKVWRCGLRIITRHPSPLSPRRSVAPHAHRSAEIATLAEGLPFPAPFAVLGGTRLSLLLCTCPVRVHQRTSVTSAATTSPSHPVESFAQRLMFLSINVDLNSCMTLQEYYWLRRWLLL